MTPRVDFITLGVRDPAASRAFYIDALGWPLISEVPGEVVFLQANAGLVLSLWSRAALAREIGVELADGVPPMTLSHNVPGRTEVDALLDIAARAGAAVVPGKQQDWGGYSGYFSDPDGFRWEICFNPTWRVHDDGAVTV